MAQKKCRPKTPLKKTVPGAVKAEKEQKKKRPFSFLFNGIYIYIYYYTYKWIGFFFAYNIKPKKKKGVWKVLPFLSFPLSILNRESKAKRDERDDMNENPLHRFCSKFWFDFLVVMTQNLEIKRELRRCSNQYTGSEVKESSIYFLYI